MRHFVIHSSMFRYRGYLDADWQNIGSTGSSGWEKMLDGNGSTYWEVKETSTVTFQWGAISTSDQGLFQTSYVVHADGLASSGQNFTLEWSMDGSNWADAFDSQSTLVNEGRNIAAVVSREYTDYIHETFKYLRITAQGSQTNPLKVRDFFVGYKAECEILAPFQPAYMPNFEYDMKRNKKAEYLKSSHRAAAVKLKVKFKSDERFFPHPQQVGTPTGDLFQTLASDSYSFLTELAKHGCYLISDNYDSSKPYTIYKLKADKVFKYPSMKKLPVQTSFTVPFIGRVL